MINYANAHDTFKIDPLQSILDNTGVNPLRENIIPILKKIIVDRGYDPSAPGKKCLSDLARDLDPLRGWGWRYIRNIWAGDMLPGKRLERAILRMANDGTIVKSVKVSSAHEIPDGTIILADARKCPCGAWFIPRTWNQKYHTVECKRKDK